MAQAAFTPASFLLRWLTALILVFATFNPTQYSFFRWVEPMDGENLPLKALAGILLLILYVIFLRATWRSIGPIGVALAAALLGALIWVGIDFGLFNISRPTVMTWVLLFTCATILAIGISWSHIRRRISGQADMDDVDE